MDAKQKQLGKLAIEALSKFALTWFEVDTSTEDTPPPEKTPEPQEEKPSPSEPKPEPLTPDEVQPAPKRRGRPPGSKNKKPEEPKPNEEPLPEGGEYSPEPAPTPKEDITPANSDELLADARAAAIQYAGTHGREALRTLLNDFTKGTIAEVTQAELPNLIKKLRS